MHIKIHTESVAWAYEMREVCLKITKKENEIYWENNIASLRLDHTKIFVSVSHELANGWDRIDNMIWV